VQELLGGEIVTARQSCEFWGGVWRSQVMVTLIYATTTTQSGIWSQV